MVLKWRSHLDLLHSNMLDLTKLVAMPHREERSGYSHPGSRPAPFKLHWQRMRSEHPRLDRRAVAANRGDEGIPRCRVHGVPDRMGRDWLTPLPVVGTSGMS